MMPRWGKFLIGIVCLGFAALVLAGLIPAISMGDSLAVSLGMGVLGIVFAVLIKWLIDVFGDSSGIKKVASTIIFIPLFTAILIVPVFVMSNLSGMVIGQEIKQSYYITCFIAGMSFMVGRITSE